MITYRRYNNNEYNDTITGFLRAHNAKFSDNRTFHKTHVYQLDDNKLAGALTVTFFWDWLSVSSVCYRDVSVLRQMILHAWQAYQDKAIGMKIYTTVKARFDDFLKVGFKQTGAVKLTDFYTDYHGDFMSESIEIDEDRNVIITDEAIPAYEELLKKQNESFRKKHKIHDLKESFNMAALDADTCIGGIQGEVYGNMLYLSRLVVDPAYRNRSIGRKLTQAALDFAQDAGFDFVSLGTCEFQARGFYEKLGFKVVHTRDESPRGYKTYTMIKWLK